MWFSAGLRLVKSERSAGAFGVADDGRRQQQNKGALRMKLWAGVVRKLGVAVLVVGGIILSAFLGSIAVAQTASAQIVVQGNRRVEASTIQSYFRLSPGERLDDVKVDEAYKALIGTGLFQDVQIRRAGSQVIVTVVEAPVINRVAFEGNKKLKDEQLTQ